MSDWSKKRIKQLGRVVTGKTPPKDEPHYFDGEELFISPKDLDWHQLYVRETATHISVKALEKFRNQVIPKNSVLFTSLSFGFGKMGISSRPSLTNQQINSVVVNSDNDYHFVYYLLQACTPFIFAYNSGIDTPIVPKSVFERIELRCPEYSEQRKIAAVLWTYDELIEKNKRRIALLKKLAEELYREWFVRLRFPGHENLKTIKGVPKNWAVKRVSEVVDFLSGYSFKSETYTPSGKFGIVTIKNVQRDHFIPECSDFIDEPPTKMKSHCVLKAGDMLMSLTGNVGRVCHVYGSDLLLNQRVAKLQPRLENASQFVYYTFNNRSMIQLIENLSLGSTAQMNLSPIQLGKQKLLVPDSALLRRFEYTVKPLTLLKISLYDQCERLKTVRDRLLPRLTSGKLSVANLDIQFPPSMTEELNKESPTIAHA